MTGETIDCYNCGRPNPEWAQVCRSCGVPLRPAHGSTVAAGRIPSDRDSLVSMGAGVGSIILAIVLGLILSGMLPEAAPIAEATPSPTPSPTPRASVDLPSEAPSVEPTPEPTPQLVGTVTFGTGINSAAQATGVTDTFGPGSAFCHSIQLTEPFGVGKIQEEVLRVEADGSLTEVQPRLGSNLTVNPDSEVAGFCAPGGTNSLISGWGTGEFVLRDYRNPDTPELLAEARFTITN